MSDDDRNARLAAALRENLKRRKAHGHGAKDKEARASEGEQE